ncbi:MAG: YigZ family protein [Bacteroidetes bacterium]|nr:MAG: YigZ family protein [Bacteroidota bacterium]
MSLPLENDTYLSIVNRCEGLYKVKGSKHYAYAFPVSSEEEIKEKLALIRVEHHAARHHCYAWRLGHDASRFRSNDDGEPSNSAGPPILGVLKSNSLTDVLIIVVRYFGGTKLGVGGLIDAYRTASSIAIKAGDIVELQRTQEYSVTYPYDKMGDVMNVLKRAGISPSLTDFQLTCRLELTVRLRDSESLHKKLKDIDMVKVELL